MDYDYRWKIRAGILFFSLAMALAAAAATGPVVRINSGRLRGVARHGLAIYKGIPFAQPPVGRLRWQPPQPVKAWSGIRAATHFGHDCMQKLFPGDAAPLRTRPSENCLYLNVWAPAHISHPLPVIFWIYGGGFVNGGTSPAPYSGAQFARDGLVFVSANYRVGRFGFFAFPALVKSGGLFGNYALMDQIAALKWVRKNIAAFGGNPGQVTIFGESAGGASVLDLLTSPLAEGLFVRAAVESGGGRDEVLPPARVRHAGPNGQPSAEADAVNFARLMGIHGSGARALAALRRLPAAAIVHGLNMASMFPQRKIYSGPVRDGKLIVHASETIMRQGGEARVPLLIGANSADLGFFFARTLRQAFAPFGAHAAAARAAFDPHHTGNVRAIAQRIGMLETMVEPARFVARIYAAAGEPAYQYRFSYIAHALRTRLRGAPHSSEIPYVFDTLRHSMWAAFGKGLTRRDEATARAMHAYWVNFAKTGDPNGHALPHWAKISPHGNQIMNFTLHGPKPETDPWRKQMDLIAAIQK